MKAAIARAQQRARHWEIEPEAVPDAAGPNCPARRAECGRSTATGVVAEWVVATLRRVDMPATVVDTESVAGEGGAPSVVLSSAAVNLPAEHAPAPRRGTSPVVGRVEEGRCLLDLRTVEGSSGGRLADAVRAVTGCR